MVALCSAAGAVSSLPVSGVVEYGGVGLRVLRHDLDAIVPALNEEGNIARAVRGERIGTLVSTPDWATASGPTHREQP